MWTYIEDYEELTGKQRESDDAPAEVITEGQSKSVDQRTVESKVVTGPESSAIGTSAVQVETA